VRDLAAFTIRTIERSTAGVFNTLSPAGRFTIGNVVDESVAAARRIARPAAVPEAVWIPADFLAEQKVEPWSDMPVWAPSVGEEAGFALVSASRALKAGLEIRSMADTVADTMRWHLQRPEAAREKLKAGLSPERESALLAAWQARASTTPG